MNQQNLYFLQDEPQKGDYGIVGVIDGSGSMSASWKSLCDAWNWFIAGRKAYCIQFDDEAEIQKQPQLNIQRGEDTDISKAYLCLAQLLKQVKEENILIVFVTDGVGEDNLQDYINQIAQLFNEIHKTKQIKLFTLAVGNDFSHQIVAEIKSRVHNSNLLSSHIEFIQNDNFKEKLSPLKHIQFYQIFTVEPYAKLAPNGPQQTRIVGNQVLLIDQQIKINGKIAKSGQFTVEQLISFADQTLAQIIMNSARGILTKEEATEAKETLIEMANRIKAVDQIKDHLDKIDQFINGFSLANITSQYIAEQYDILTKKKPDSYISRADANKLAAQKLLNAYKAQIKIKPIFEPLQKFFNQNKKQSPAVILKMILEGKSKSPQLADYAQDYEQECQKIIQLMHIVK